MSSAPMTRGASMFSFPDPSSTAPRFQGAGPFPHIVLDDVLSNEDAERLIRAFPTPDWSRWTRFNDRYQHQKMVCSDVLAMPPTLRAAIVELSTPRTLGFLSELTGIPKLIPDPYLDGGGLHCSGPGGVLAPHSDFHVYERLGLYRRLNVILYLNPGWEPGDGGELMLFADANATRPSRRVEPISGRMVVFQTDDGSVHGFPEPVAPERWRRSIALYYYTASATKAFSGDTNTYWRHHADARGSSRLRFGAYRSLLFASRAFSHLAHRANPHFTPPVSGEDLPD
jgi:Rps23 Pro-64 3,4-dihydroxylase Tpa1-like proline 4-hydroxylase